LPSAGRLVIAEFTPAIVEWNRQHVGEFARRPLDDPRTQLHLGDAVAHLRGAHAIYDALLLDIDNGPSALVHESNQTLYGDKGVAACFAALRPGGVMTVWSASGDDGYLKRLVRAGFVATAEIAGARTGSGRGVRHVIFVALRPRARAATERTR
jgi:spermidine synthase